MTVRIHGANGTVVIFQKGFAEFVKMISIILYIINKTMKRKIILPKMDLKGSM